MAFNQIKGLSLKIDVFFFEHGTLFAFLTIFFLFISCVLFVRMLKRRFETLRLDRKYWVTLFILFVVVSGVYWSIASQRVFFSYEETDLKFFSDAITLSNSGEYRPVGTPRGGFFYLLIFIFNLFPFLREIGNLFFFIIISNYLTILLISFLVFDMFYSRFKGNNIISLLLSLTIVIYKPVLDAVWRYKLFYVIPTCGLFLAYYIFLRLKSLFKDRKRHMFKDKLLYSIFLLIVIYFISHTRPEFLVFSLPILFYSLPLYYREYKKSSSKQRVCYVLLFFLVCSY
jgi:hypothetical protein